MIMKKLNSKESKEVLLNILLYFDDICKKNSLNYTLAYGTLLGAARHKGFIPWDDDIDVEMPINDYIKLIRILNNQSSNERYQLHNSNTEDKFEENYYYPFAKLEDSYTKVDFLKTRDKGGAFIDIFPMTPLPREKRRWWLYNKKARVLKITLAVLNGKNRSKIRNFVSLLGNEILDYKKVRDKLWNLSIKYVDNSSDFVVDGTWHDYKDKNYFPKVWFKNYVSLEFEGYQLSVLSNYLEMLEHDYGDWSKLPPKEKQVSHHDYLLYLKEE